MKATIGGYEEYSPRGNVALRDDGRIAFRISGVQTPVELVFERHEAAELADALASAGKAMPTPPISPSHSGYLTCAVPPATEYSHTMYYLLGNERRRGIEVPVFVPFTPPSR